MEKLKRTRTLSTIMRHVKKWYLVGILLVTVGFYGPEAAAMDADFVKIAEELGPRAALALLVLERGASGFLALFTKLTGDEDQTARIESLELARDEDRKEFSTFREEQRVRDQRAHNNIQLLLAQLDIKPIPDL